MRPFATLFLFLLPLVEIAGFVLVGRQIGVLPTLGLVLASGIAGMILLRVQGFGAMTRIRREMRDGRDPGREVAHGVMIVLAGVLLLVPGFFTDVVGLLLFLPPVRDVAWRFLRGRIHVVGGFAESMGRRGPGGPRGRTIDLDDGDYSREPDDSSPWRRIDGD